MNTYKALLGLLIVSSLQACKDDAPASPSDPSTPTGQADLRMEVGFHFGSGDFDLANTYTDGEGRAIRFTTLRFFMSNLLLQSDAGDAILEDREVVWLVDAATGDTAFTITDLPTGLVHTLRMNLGLDSAVNHSDPMQYDAAPLNDATMHWGWNPAVGYKFLQMEGHYDDDDDGVVDASDPTFSYHCASDAMRRELILPLEVDVVAGGTATRHVEVFVDRIMQSVNTMATPMAHGGGAVNTALMQNLVGSFEVE
jgi:hypothetical protein